MRIQTWERYVPDVDDNRDRHRRGEPAFVVSIRPPTARVWFRFWTALSESNRWSAFLAARQAEHGSAVASQITLRLALMDEGLAEILWLPCVGPVEHFPDIGQPVPDGAALWALRDALDSTDVYIDVLEALVLRTHLDEGLASFLASASGPPALPAVANTDSGVPASTATLTPV